jgi:hypothetical protein
LANSGVSFLRQANGGYKVSSRAFPVYQDTVLAGRIVENATSVGNASVRLSSGEVAMTNDRGFFAVVINKAPIYVAADATGDNTGRSWNHAFTSLQNALDVAAPGDEIWVKQGVYYPEKTASGSIVNPYFFAGTREYFEDSEWLIRSVEKQVRIYGGFHGDELGRHQRNWKLYPTILSGDIRFRPGVTAVCSRVIALSSESELDGFIVQKSSQVGVDVAANAVVRNCLVRDHGNTGVKLGQSSSLVSSVVTGVVSTNGSAVQFSGANGRMENCMVVGNSSLFSASGTAAGISVRSSGSSIIGCTLAQNVSSNGSLSRAGAISGTTGMTLTIANCIIAGNSKQGLSQISNVTVTASNSCITADSVTGSANLTVDPQFSDLQHPAGADGVFMTEDDGLALSVGSPCINSGANSVVREAYDVVHAARIIGSLVDMGCYENGSAIIAEPNSQPLPLDVARLVTLTIVNGSSTKVLRNVGIFPRVYNHLGSLDLVPLPTPNDPIPPVEPVPVNPPPVATTQLEHSPKPLSAFVLPVSRP